jgi:hypothetical protein
LGSGILAGYNGYAAIFPDYNCAVGYNSQNINGDSYNTSIGANSLLNLNGLSDGVAYNTQYNTAVGYNAGTSQARLNYCSFLGAGADVNTNNLTYATAIGAGAIATASNTIMLGRGTEVTYVAGGLNLPASKVFTILGSITANSLSVSATQLGFLNYLKLGANQGWGQSSLNVVTTATDCVAYGPNTLTRVTTSIQNTALGSNAGWGVTGVNNTCVGAFANGGVSPVSCANNTSVGNAALFNSTGNQNTSVGSNSGTGLVAGANNVTIGYNSSVTYNHNNCTLVGAATDLNAAGYTSSTALGYGATITGSNQIILGTAADTTYAMGGLNIPSSKVLTLLGTITANSLSVTPTQVGYLNGVSTGIVDTASTQTIGGVKTFSSAPIITSQYVHSAGTQLTGTTTPQSIATAPYYETYNIAVTGAITITIPSPVAGLNGVKLNFRRTNTSAVAITSSIGYYPFTSNAATTTALLTASSTTQAGNSISLICLLVSGTTYAWFQI